ncbi:MAG: hypothetical protein ACE5E9_00065 [Nitrospinaceae bacterium]
MENLDLKIDTMVREKLVSLIQENSVRVGKINIRYTKNNKKYSMERLDALYATGERLLRFIPKQLLKIEKGVRIKFQVPMEEKRKKQVLANLQTEAETIIQQMIVKLRDLHTYLGQDEAFDRKIEQTRLKTKEDIEQQVEKMAEALRLELATERKMSPAELRDKYGIGEETLIQLNLVKVLQDIHLIFDKLKERVPVAVLEGVHEAFIQCIKIGEKVAGEIPPAHKVKERKAWKMVVARNTLDLKEIIFSTQALAEQVQIPKDRRNFVIIQKNWDRIAACLKDKPDSEEVFSRLKPFYELLEVGTERMGKENA